MKYLKKVLLATGLIATTLGMSVSANAGAIIQQDIYADVLFADFNPFGITEGPQMIGSVTYNTDLADDAGFLFNEGVELDLSVGSLMLSMADSESVQYDLPVVAGFNPFDPFAGLDFMIEVFNLYGDMPDYVLTLDISSFGGSLVLDEVIYDQNGGVEDVFPIVIGETTLGEVTYVPEPSALVLMLAGLGLLVRRKVAAK